MDFASLLEFAEYLNHVEHKLEDASERALELGAKMIWREARRVIGMYDYGWPELAESTQGQRESLGFEPDEPLLRTGELRDSIDYTILIPGQLAEIGSNSDIAVYQELGTSTIPARSFLAGAALAKEEKIAQTYGRLSAAALAGGHSLESELAHILVEAAESLGHAVKEATFMDHDEDGNEHRH